MTQLAQQKLHVLEFVAGLSEADRRELNALYQFMLTLRAQAVPPAVVYADRVREKPELSTLAAKQHFEGSNQEEVDQLVARLDIQEPLEELLKMVKG